MKILPRRTAVALFLAFAFAYFLSALIRAITATLSPALIQEFALSASNLGLLAGGYFLGFAATQLPLGAWLDRHGPRRVLLCLLTVAALACVAFSLATSFSALLLARVLCGVGVSACLMAPLTGYRRWFEPVTLLRANSWMLMTGSLGMVASTLPVQWLLPVAGWRVLFLALALLVLISMGVIAWQIPRWTVATTEMGDASPGTSGHATIWKNAYFCRMVPIGFFCYGGLIAIQTLWAAPWMIRVADYSPEQAANGLFWINVAMLCAFWTWGLINPWLTRKGWHADRLIALGLPISFVLLGVISLAGSRLAPVADVLWALYCVSCTFVALAQPAVGMAFAPALAGRALSAYNLVIFAGVFSVQWGIGLAVDGFKALGVPELQALQWAMGLFLLCCLMSYGYFLAVRSHNQTI